MFVLWYCRKQVCAPTIQASVNFCEYEELNIFVIFEQISFKLGNFASLKVLFPAESMDFF